MRFVPPPEKPDGAGVIRVEDTMSYKQAAHILPPELLRAVQDYIDGECIYIPRLAGQRRDWGETTATRRELRQRNERIFAEYLRGEPPETLAARYYLTVKSIQRIIRRERAVREK